MNDLYKLIEELGKGAGYKNMTALCTAAGVSRSVMSELNAGRSKEISKQNAQRFADLLGLSLDVVYGGEQKEKAPAKEAEASEMADILQEFRDNPELKTLFSLSRKATPEELRQYADVIRALRGNRDE